MLKFIKHTTTAFLIGVPCGGWIVHSYETVPIVDLIARGYCGQNDVRGTLFFFNCVDSLAVADIRQHDIESDKVLAEMARNEPAMKRAVGGGGKKR